MGSGGSKNKVQPDVVPVEQGGPAASPGRRAAPVERDEGPGGEANSATPGGATCGALPESPSTAALRGLMEPNVEDFETVPAEDHSVVEGNLLQTQELEELALGPGPDLQAGASRPHSEAGPGKSSELASSGIEEIPSVMATQSELEEIPSVTATQSELEEIPSMTATQSELEEIPSMTATQSELAEKDGRGETQKTILPASPVRTEPATSAGEIPEIPTNTVSSLPASPDLCSSGPRPTASPVHKSGEDWDEWDAEPAVENLQSVSNQESPPSRQGNNGVSDLPRPESKPCITGGDEAIAYGAKPDSNWGRGAGKLSIGGAEYEGRLPPLQCTSCGFNVLRFSGCRWAPDVDYMHFRNFNGHSLNLEKLTSRLLVSEDSAAYACQCAWQSTSELKSLNQWGTDPGDEGGAANGELRWKRAKSEIGGIRNPTAGPISSSSC